MDKKLEKELNDIVQAAYDELTLHNAYRVIQEAAFKACIVGIRWEPDNERAVS